MGENIKDKRKLEPDKDYLGIPRKEILWYPSIEEKDCDTCGSCVDFCNLGTYSNSKDGSKAVVSNPYNYVLGCNGCEDKCANNAISFPSTEVIGKVRKKYGV